MTFSLIVAWAVFVLVSLLFCALLYDGLRTRSEAELALERLEAYVKGYTVKTDWRKIFVLFVVWFAAGYYIWG